MSRKRKLTSREAALWRDGWAQGRATGRREGIGIEIEERYCEIAARRCAQEVMDLKP